MAIEEPAFTIESQTAHYDIRLYPSMLVAETRIEAGFDEAGTRGFRILADYIFGNNQSRTKMAKPLFATQEAPREKIAMTAPVGLVQSPWGFLVQFTMPTSFKLATLPKPNDARVHLREIPERRIAVLRYSGSWSEDRYQKKRKELVAALKEEGVQAIGDPCFARFNSPFMPWFLRRNEIWIEVAP
ncbi:MAG: heme-binding protein [Holophagaceae bacterium]|uniref:Heme-binding protein n=1 Tax=Candidatus Geothrix skivensis TaxID=2954439 RepID=A0A9D7XIV8_9BACT|nr:heme-binding protein [Candidatus Geothrix skivensis]